MSEGGGSLLQSNIILHGPPGTGKTSLKRVIVGLPPLPKKSQKATGIMENAVRAVCTDRFKQFKVIENEELINMIADVVEGYFMSKEVEPELLPVAQLPGNQLEDCRTLPSKENAKSLSTPSNLPALTSTRQVSTKTATMISISRKLKHAKPSSDMFSSQWYHVVDSGGQPQFHDILPLVYRSPSLHIVVVRLSDGLDTKPQVCFYEGGKNVYSLKDHLVLTNRQFIIRMCQTAASCASSGGPIPYVMIVGTHKDKLGRSSKSKIEQINQDLKSLRMDFPRILICKSDTQTLFDINTMATGKERQRYTEELQTIIYDAVQKSVVPQPIPLKWLVFQLDLDEGEGMVKIEKCYKEGKELGMRKADVKDALVYFNKSALLFYFPNDLPDLVLTKVDPLINRLSKLVKASFICPKRTLCAESEKLRNKGLFNEAFVEQVLFEAQPSDLSVSEFLKLLECLKIAVLVEGEEYFLPSALSFEASQEYEFKVSFVPLAFSWSDRILPHGFFFTVAVEILGRSNETSSYSFKLRKDIAQCRQEIQVSEKSGKIPGVMKLRDRMNWIQVSYSASARHCPKIRKAVQEAIERTVERFKPHTGIGYPIVTCLCPLCETKDHYCILTPDKKEFTCSVNESKTGEVTEGMLCWFEGEYSLLSIV